MSDIDCERVEDHANEWEEINAKGGQSGNYTHFWKILTSRDRIRDLWALTYGFTVFGTLCLVCLEKEAHFRQNYGDFSNSTNKTSALLQGGNCEENKQRVEIQFKND